MRGNDWTDICRKCGKTRKDLMVDENGILYGREKPAVDCIHKFESARSHPKGWQTWDDVNSNQG